jgi:tetratricopeptide (TPR) repeat protein
LQKYKRDSHVGGAVFLPCLPSAAEALFTMSLTGMRSSISSTARSLSMGLLGRPFVRRSREDVTREEEEDGRYIDAILRHSEYDRSYRVYFLDGTYLEIEGQIAGWSLLWEEGFPPAEGEEVEPWDAGWEEIGWRDLPWVVREEVGRCLEEAIAPQGERLAEELLCHPFKEQLRVIEERSDLHEWSLALALLGKGREALASCPSRAADLLTVAERLTHSLDGYSGEWVVELRARVLSHLGNTLRILGDFGRADETFREALQCLSEARSLTVRVTEAETLALQAQLFRDELRFDEALPALRTAGRLYKEEGAAALAAGVLIEEAAIRGDRGEREEAFALLREAKSLLGELPKWDLRARLKEEGHRLWRLFYGTPPLAEEDPEGAPAPT